MNKEDLVSSCPEIQRSFQLGAHSQSWFALFTRSNHEKSIARYFAERRLEHYLPLCTSVHRWSHDRKAKVESPLFPGYIFVRIGEKERIRVLSAPGALSLVGHGAVPTPIPDSEIDLLRTALKAHRFEPHPYLAVGARVRVRAGSLAGMAGVIVRWKNGFRVLLSIDLIQKSVALEIDSLDLEPLPQDC